MKFRMWGTWVVAAAVALVAMGASAEASSITSLIDFDPTGNTTNQISDDSVENITGFTGALKVGDIVEGILNITSLGDISTTLKSVGAGTANNELTAIFRTVVRRVTFLHDNGTPGDTSDDIYSIAFGPDDTWSFAAGLGVAGGAGTGTGAMVIFFEDNAQNFTKNNAATDVANAVDGKYFWALGMNTALPTDIAGNVTGNSNSASEGWVATSRLTLPAANNQIGTAVYSLNRVWSTNAPNNSTPIPGVGDAYALALQEGAFSPSGTADVEVLGTTTFNSQVGSSSGWNINNQAEFFIIPLSVVPVPAAAWMGFALLGALGLGRRLRRRT